MNYKSAEFDAVFLQLETMGNGPERLKLIAQANEILRKDAPVCWGFHRTSFVLTHGWYGNYKPHMMAKCYLKCRRINLKEREQKRIAWNDPRLMPVFVAYAIMLLLLLPGLIVYTNRKSKEV